MTNMTVKGIDPFTRSLIYKVRDEEGFGTIAEALSLVMYEYYEKKELYADGIEKTNV